MEIISADKIDADDPHGYCDTSPVDTQKRFRIPWKRRNLGNEVRELHIMNDARVIPPSTTGYFNKELLCKLIDDILEIQRPKPAYGERVKRRLFCATRELPRKNPVARKNRHSISTAFKFRSIRHRIGYRHIKKNYLDEARLKVLDEVRRERAVKRRSESSSTDSSYSPEVKRSRTSSEWPASANGMLHIKTDDGMFPISPNTLAEICKFHDKMVRQHPSKVRTEYEQFKRNLNTEACRLSRRVSKLAGLILEEQYRQRVDINTKVVEESARSIHYLKSILEILMDQGDKGEKKCDTN